MDLFDFTDDNINKTNSPLAERMRPTSLENFVGQKHILSDNSLLIRAIKSDKLGSCIFYGPPGTGKTTLASIIAGATKGHFEKLNAVSSGVADAKAVIERAKNNLKMYGKKTYLLLDECHRWNKAQSDCVLSAIEDGSIIFIGSTTENPFVGMTRAIVSRCRIFELKQLTDEDIISSLKRAVQDKKHGLGNYKLSVDEDAYAHLSWGANGDLRNALNGLELAVLSTTPNAEGKIKVTREIAEQSIQKKCLSIDENMYYDMLSAFCKSLRGSSVEGALYWAFRLTEGGCDPLLIFRRMLAHASEDVGMADSNALNIVTNAYLSYERMGYKEGRIPMTHAIIYICTCPKSNSVVEAMANALAMVERDGSSEVPYNLRDRHYKSTLDTGQEYVYPHSYGGYVNQQYLPDSIKNEIFYCPTNEGDEKRVREFIEYKNKMADKNTPK